MGSTTIKKNDASEESSRTYDTASIRYLELEEQNRRRAYKLETWMRLRKPCPGSGRKKLSAEDATKIVFWFKFTWNQTRDSAGSDVVTRKEIKKQGNDFIFRKFFLT